MLSGRKEIVIQVETKASYIDFPVSSTQFLHIDKVKNSREQ